MVRLQACENQAEKSSGRETHGDLLMFCSISSGIRISRVEMDKCET